MSFVGVVLLGGCSTAAVHTNRNFRLLSSSDVAQGSFGKSISLRGGELMPNVDTLETEADLDVVLDEAGSALVVVDFYVRLPRLRTLACTAVCAERLLFGSLVGQADWCGPCKKLAPTVESLARKTSSAKVLFYKVDVDQARELTAAQGVKSMPTLQFFRNKQKVHQIVGGDSIRSLRQEVAKATLPAAVRILRIDALAATALASPQQSAMLLAAMIYVLMPWQRVLQA